MEDHIAGISDLGVEMAGDWLPMRHDLPEDPAVISIACATGLDEDSVVGKLLRVWRWFDSQTTDGNAPGVTRSWLDRYVNAAGFSDAMIVVKWLRETEDGLEIPNFNRFISQSAKQRVLTAKRVASHRGKGKQKCNADTVTGALPKEQKRTEELTPLTPQGGLGEEDERPIVAEACTDEPPSEPFKDPAPVPARVAQEVDRFAAMIPLPSNLETLPFRAAWRKWLAYLAEKSHTGRLSQTSLTNQLTALSPLGPWIAELTLENSITANWSILKSEDAEREWQRIVNEADLIEQSTFQGASRLDLWWRNTAKGHLRSQEARTRILALACDSIAKYPHRAPAAFVEALARQDPWSDVEPESFEKARQAVAHIDNPEAQVA